MSEKGNGYFKQFITVATYTVIGTFVTGLYQVYLNNTSIKAIHLPKSIQEFTDLLTLTPKKTYATIAAVSFASYVAFKIIFRNSKIQYKHKYTQPTADTLSVYDSRQNCYVIEPDAEKPIYKSRTGCASIEPKTLMHYFDKCYKESKNKIVFGKEYKDENGEYEWKFTTQGDYYTQVQTVARSFIKLGLRQYQSVCIIGFNSPEWLICDVGAIYAGALACGLYSTNNSGQIKFICNDCQCHTIVVENKKQLNKVLPILNELKTVEAIVVYDDDISDIEYKNSKIKLLDWIQFLDIGNQDKGELNKEIEQRKANIKPGMCAALVYTSGTTGNPKGTIISHDSIVFDIHALIETTPHVNWTNARLISYLPLSHIAGALCDIYGPIVINGLRPDARFIIHFARPDALKGSLPLTMKYVKPTIFLGVPRVWEKIEGRMKEVGKKGGFITKTIGNLAKKVGAKYHKNKLLTGNKYIPFGFNFLDNLVYSKLKSKLGLDKCELFATAAAPIKASTLKYFGSLNVHLTQIYGLSETSGASTAGLCYYDKTGCVGVAAAGTEIIIDHVDGRDKHGEGEILIRGRQIMSGYLNNLKKTKEAIDNKGYFHSGDVGKIDDDGLIWITGRIKELIITAGGENVAPVPIEQYLKTNLDALSNIVLIGDKKKYLTILVTLQCKQEDDGINFTNELTGNAKNISPNSNTVDEARNDTIWKEYITNGIMKYNNDPNGCVSNAQKVQYFKILDRDFSVATELTDTLKLKRRVINDQYKNEIESMYNK